MDRHIQKIGNARYTFNQAALCAFIAQAKVRATESARCGTAQGVYSDGGADGAAGRLALQPVFDEADRIIALYRAYRSSQNVELLVELKRRLEQVSVRYESHALAEEVLSINSCLPYERRVPQS